MSKTYNSKTEIKFKTNIPSYKILLFLVNVLGGVYLLVTKSIFIAGWLFLLNAGYLFVMFILGYGLHSGRSLASPGKTNVIQRVKLLLGVVALFLIAIFAILFGRE